MEKNNRNAKCGTTEQNTRKFKHHTKKPLKELNQTWNSSRIVYHRLQLALVFYHVQIPDFNFGRDVITQITANEFQMLEFAFDS